MVAMQFWKPHSLAKPHDGQLDLRLGDLDQRNIAPIGRAARRVARAAAKAG